MRLILIGPPGSGKGTQAQLLCERLRLAHIGTGDILRDVVRLGTPKGLEAKPYVDSGKLAPDDLVNEVVAELFRQEHRPERFVMDGYPRTLAQAVSFDQVLRQQFLDLQAAILLAVEDDEIVRRLDGRWVCPNCKATYHITMRPPHVAGVCNVCGGTLVQREDDQEETIRRRLALYHQKTEDLIDYYRRGGLLHEIPAAGGIEEIYGRIRAALQHLCPND